MNADERRKIDDLRAELEKVSQTLDLLKSDVEFVWMTLRNMLPERPVVR